jgi:hypothetical protein
MRSLARIGVSGRPKILRLIACYSFSFADEPSGFTADPGRAGDSLLVDPDRLPDEPSLAGPDIPEAPPVLPNVTPSFAAVC